MAGNGVILYDANGNPVAAPQNGTLSSSPTGILNAGIDYGPSPRGQLIKVDASGSQYVVPSNPGGGSTLVSAGQAAGPVESQYGSLSMARMDSPAPSAFYPLALDQLGSLQVHQKSKPTFSVVALGAPCGAGNVLFGIQNAGSMVLRLSRVNVYIPPAGGTGAALLGAPSGQSYFPVFCEMRRAASFAGGVAAIPMPADSKDSLAAGISCARSITSVQGPSATFYQADAYVTNLTGIPFYERGTDPNAKTFLVRPGECILVVCTSNGVVNSSTAGANPVVANANLLVSFTQAVA